MVEEVSLTASKTDVLPGEIVEFTTKVSPAKSVAYTLKAYDSTGRLIGMWDEVTDATGVDTVRLVPSIIDPKISTWQSEAEGVLSNTVEVTVKVTPTPPTSITLTASNTEPKPGEIVTFRATTTPAVTETATLYAYVSGIRKAEWSLPIVDGVGQGTYVPSVIGDVVDWKVVDYYGVESNVVTTRVYKPPTPPEKLELAVSNPSPDVGEMVTFTVTTTPAVTESSTIYAYTNGREVARWHLPIVDGSGIIRLVPSETGDVVDWKVVDSFGVESNVVRTAVKAPPPPPPTKGTLKVYAYADGEEVTASVVVLDVGTYETPFSLDLDPGTYTLKATYDTQTDTKTATIEEGETTVVVFHFSLAPVWPSWWPIAAAAGGVALAAVVGVVAYQEYRRREELMLLAGK